MLAFTLRTPRNYGTTICVDLVGLSAVFVFATLGAVMLKKDFSYGELSELITEFVAYQQLLF